MEESEKYVRLKAEILTELEKAQSTLQFWLNNPQFDSLYQQQIQKNKDRLQVLNQFKALIDCLENNQLINQVYLDLCYQLPEHITESPEK